MTEAEALAAIVEQLGTLDITLTFIAAAAIVIAIRK